MNNNGFSLLEVLIATMIFSIGLLGLASLQALSLKISADTMNRTIAALLTNDIIDRMRANVAETKKGTTSAYNNPNRSATANSQCYGMSYQSGSYVSSSTAQCTSVQMAQNDFADWYATIKGSAATAWGTGAITAQLPSGDGVVCIDSVPNDGIPTAPNCDNTVVVAGKPVYSVKIWWIERKDKTSPGTLHRYVTSFSL
jgi:type IV pilus assembly protein PilV